MKPSVSRFVVLASLSLAVSSHRASAVAYTWINGESNFIWDNVALNWADDDSEEVWIDGNAAILDNLAPGAITVEGTRTISGLTTLAAGYSIKGGSIALGVPATPFEINNQITINSAITGGTNGILKTGAGSLVLGGGLGNSFSGPIEVNAGRVSNANGASLKNVSSPISVASGATFNAQQNFDANAVANAFTLSGNGSGYDGQGALNIATNVNVTGPVTLLTDVKITHDWNAGTISGTVTGADKNLLLTNLQSGQPGMAINGNISLGSGGITIQSSAGAGLVTLGGTNAYSGGTKIGVGGLVVTKGGALGSGNVTFTVGSTLRGGATLSLPNEVVIDSGINATLSAVSGAVFTHAGALTGSGTLAVSGPGSVMLSGGLANTFSGPITVSSGRLGCVNGSSMKNIPGTITVASGATFDAQQAFEATNIATNFMIGGTGSGISGGQGALNLQGNANLTGAVTLTADTKITHDWNTGVISGPVSGTNTSLQLATLVNTQPGLTISGPVSLGSGGITTTGAGGTASIALTGTLSYTGETKVETGTLSLSGNARLNDASTVRIASGAVLDLGFSGTDTVAALYLGGNLMPEGTYGSLASDATNKSADFAGSGVLSVGASASTYSGWAASHAGGQTSELDFDGDGVANAVEYFMGVTAAGFTPTPTLVGNAITWPKDPAAVATYVVETSTNLKDEVIAGDGGWAPVAAGVVDHGTSVTYTSVPGAPKCFIRLKVAVTP